jgi:hypothetical protein
MLSLAPRTIRATSPYRRVFLALSNLSIYGVANRLRRHKRPGCQRHRVTGHLKPSTSCPKLLSRACYRVLESLCTHRVADGIQLCRTILLSRHCHYTNALWNDTSACQIATRHNCRKWATGSNAFTATVAYTRAFSATNTQCQSVITTCWTSFNGMRTVRVAFYGTDYRCIKCRLAWGSHSGQTDVTVTFEAKIRRCSHCGQLTLRCNSI